MNSEAKCKSSLPPYEERLEAMQAMCTGLQDSLSRIEGAIERLGPLAPMDPHDGPVPGDSGNHYLSRIGALQDTLGALRNKASWLSDCITALI